MNDKVTNLLLNTRKFLGKHSPEILTGIGIAGLLSSTVLAVKATPKAMLLRDEELNRQEVNKLKPLELVKTCWKPYIPAVIMGVAGTSCIVGASAIHYKRNAALATVYAISERTLTTYRDKVVETIGEKKEKEIRQKIAQDGVDKDKESNDKPLVVVAKGQTLCKDSITGRYFRSDLNAIRKAINLVNRRLTIDHYISLNEWFGELCLDDVKNGSLMGWNLDNGLLDVTFETCLADNDEPCIVLEYSLMPKYDFDKLM